MGIRFAPRSRGLMVVALLWGGGLIGGKGGVLHAAPPAADALRQQAERCDRLLRSSLVDFYLPACIDGQNGGYLETYKDGHFVATGEKFVTMQARQLWFFATLARAGINQEKALAAATAGFQFLQQHFYDPQHGGYFAKTDDVGQPTDRRKHAYLNSFVLYGLVAYYEAARDPAALQAAKDLFETFDHHAHDATNGGYNEFFQQDWTPVSPTEKEGYIGAPGTKTFNTHLHLLESFAALYRVWPDERLRHRLEELLHINTNTLHLYEYGCNLDAWQPNWQLVDTRQNHRASYGHDIEAAWLAIDAARILGYSPLLLRNWAERLCGYSLKNGYDTKYGGYLYAGPNGQPADDHRKEWWVQAEGLISALEMYRLTGKPEYYRVFTETLDFIEKHHLAPGGGWWSTCNREGTTPSATVSSPWQGAYHNGRALLLSAKLLRELAEKPR